MDMNKFYKCLINDERIKDLPIILVLQVTVIILDIINSGDCMYDLEKPIF